MFYDKGIQYGVNSVVFPLGATLDDKKDFYRHHYVMRDKYQRIAGRSKGVVGFFGVELQGVVISVTQDYRLLTVGRECAVKHRTSVGKVKVKREAGELRYVKKVSEWFSCLESARVSLPFDTKRHLEYFLYGVPKSQLLDELNNWLAGLGCKPMRELLPDELAFCLKAKKKFRREVDSKVITGAGITLVKPSKDYLEYQEAIREVLEELKTQLPFKFEYEVRFANTTNSCYVSSWLGMHEFKFSIRNHERIESEGYYRVYHDSKDTKGLLSRLVSLCQYVYQVGEGA